MGCPREADAPPVGVELANEGLEDRRAQHYKLTVVADVIAVAVALIARRVWVLMVRE